MSKKSRVLVIGMDEKNLLVIRECLSECDVVTIDMEEGSTVPLRIKRRQLAARWGLPYSQIGCVSTCFTCSFCKKVIAGISRLSLSWAQFRVQIETSQFIFQVGYFTSLAANFSNLNGTVLGGRTRYAEYP